MTWTHYTSMSRRYSSNVSSSVASLSTGAAHTEDGAGTALLPASVCVCPSAVECRLRCDAGPGSLRATAPLSASGVPLPSACPELTDESSQPSGYIIGASAHQGCSVVRAHQQGEEGAESERHCAAVCSPCPSVAGHYPWRPASPTSATPFLSSSIAFWHSPGTPAP